MSIENVESSFKNRLLFEFSKLGDWAMNGDFWVKEHISTNSKIFNLSSLNINNIYDLMEEATPSIYYMVSWLEDHFKNKKYVCIPYEVEGVSTFYIPDDTIIFSIILYFYNEVIEEKHQWNPEGYIDLKLILEFEFKFDDLTKDENILTKIKTRINEELKKNSDLTFFTNFVKIRIDYIVIHPPDIEDKIMEADYVEKTTIS